MVTTLFKQRSSWQGGSITLWVVFMLIIFAIMLSASLAFITRQSHATIIQEQEEQAFAAAEGGVHHALWLLNSGTKTVSNLNSFAVANEPMTNANGDVLARFSLTFSAVDATAGGVTVLAVGRDENQPNICQAIEARVQRGVTGGFSVVRWEHRITYQCPAVATTPTTPVVPTPITLGTNLGRRELKAAEVVHHYTFTATAGTKFRIKVRGTGFTPTLTLRDRNGAEVANAGFPYRLAHVRFAGMLQDLRDSLRASVNVGTAPNMGCNKAIYLACIPWDEQNDLAWATAPLTGSYSLEVRSSTTQFGFYQLETDKQ